MTLDTILLLIGGLIFLVAGGELLVRGASRLAAALGVAPVTIGLTVVAFGTSAPELAVSLDAVFNGQPDIAAANVVGSNIFNLFFILGVSALISPLIIHSLMIKREVPVMIFSAIILYVFSLGGLVSRLEGAALFLMLVVYTGWLVKEAMKKRRDDKELIKESEEAYGDLKKDKKPILLSAFFVIAGLGIIMLGADWLVDGAVKLAQSLGVSNTVIGLTIVAAGTSLPEVVASIIATIKGERDIAVGNVVGSNIFNIFGILGLTGGLSPTGLTINNSLLTFDIPFMILISVLGLFAFMSNSRLSRLEGGLFLAGYVGYTIYLIDQASKVAS